MMDSRSVPRLVTLLSESLLSGASCHADEKRTRTRSLSRLAYTTLLGLNQAVMMDVDEDHREQVNDLKLQQTQGAVKASEVSKLVGNFQQHMLFPQPAWQEHGKSDYRLLMFGEHQAVISLLLDLQGSVPKADPISSGLFIPEPMHFDLASGSIVCADSAMCNLLGGHEVFSPTWQSRHSLQGQAEVPDQNRMRDISASNFSVPGKPHQSQNQCRDPFRLLPNAAFEQQPDARLLAIGYEGQAAEQQQRQHSDASMQRHSSQQHQENAALVQHTSWQAQTHSVQGMLASMQQKPAWVEPCIQGGEPEAAPQGAIGGMPMSLPLSLLQMDALPGSLTGFSPTPVTHQTVDLPVIQANPWSEALQPLSLETAARQQIGASSPTMVLRTPAQPVPARQHNVDRGSESLRSSDEFPSNKENSHGQHRPNTGLHAMHSGPHMHATGRKLEGVEVVPEHVLAQEAVYALQGIGPSIARLASGKLCTPEALPASLASLLKPIVQSGQRRQMLEAFVAAFGVDGSTLLVHSEGNNADPISQAFAAAVQQQLRSQSAALQQLPAAVQARRCAELPAVLGKAFPIGGRNSRMTVLEVALHTQRLQAQLHTLACICWSEPCPVSHALQLNTVSAAQSVRQLQHNTATDMKQCRWTQEGFPKGPALLTHLHTELTDADSDFAPLLRELMLAAIQPYMQHVRSWLYSTAAVLPGLVSGDVDDLNGMQALHAVVNKSRTSEGKSPEFLRHVQHQLILAGWQLRVLDKLKPASGSFVSQVDSIAAAEAAEAALAVTAAGEQTQRDISWDPTCSLKAQHTSTARFPLVFTSTDLQKVQEVSAKASQERMLEADVMLASLAEQRQLAAAAADEKVLLRKQQLHNAREAARARKAEEVRQQRVHRARLLKDQQAAMSAHQAGLQAANLMRIRQEQEVLQAAAEQEHSEALSAAKAAVASGRQELHQMQQQAQRMAWRTQRWHLASRRRTAFQALEAAEDSEVAILASDPLMRQAAPSLSSALFTSTTTAPATAAATPATAAVPVAVPSADHTILRHDQTEPTGSAATVALTVAATTADNTEQFDQTAAASARLGSTTSQAPDPEKRDAAAAETKADSMTSQEAISRTLDAAAAETAAGSCSGSQSSDTEQRRKTWGQATQPFVAAGKASASGESAASLLRGPVTDAAGDVSAVTHHTKGDSAQGTDAHPEDHSASQTDNLIETATPHLAPTADTPATAADNTLTAESASLPVQPELAATAEADVQNQAATPAGLRSKQWGPVQNPFPAAGQAKAPLLSHTNRTSSHLPASQEHSGRVPTEPSYTESDAARVQQSAAEQSFLAQPITDAATACDMQSSDSADAHSTAAFTSDTRHPVPQATTSRIAEPHRASPPKHAAMQQDSSKAARIIGSSLHQLAGGSPPVASSNDLEQHTVIESGGGSDTTPSGATRNDMEQSAVSRAATSGQAVSQSSAAVSSFEASRPAAGSARPRREWGRIVHPFAAAGAAPHPPVTTGDPRPKPGDSQTHVTQHSSQLDQTMPPAALSHPRRTWSHHMASSQPDSSATGASPVSAASSNEDCDDSVEHEDDMVPLSVVIDTCLVQGIKHQYSCVSRACIGLLRDEFKLNNLLHALQQYFFMAAGDWAEGLTDALTTTASQHSRLYQHNVQSMLEASLKGTSMEHDSEARRLKVSLVQPKPESTAVHRRTVLSAHSPGQPSSSRAATPSAPRRGLSSRDAAAGVKIDVDQLRAFDAIQLSYDVEWPLSLIVTQESVQQYSQVFSWLLCLKRVSLAMRQLWSQISCTTASANRASRRNAAATSQLSEPQGSATNSTNTGMTDAAEQPGQASQEHQSRQQECKQRINALQLFRHEAAQFAAALQSYMQAQLLGTCWQQLQEDIQSKAADVLELNEAHNRYMTLAQHVCLLSPSSRELRLILEIMLQSVVDFASIVRTAHTDSDIQEVVSDDTVWSNIVKKKQDFSSRCKVLYKLLKYASGRGRYQELFVLLDMNDFYVSEV